MTTPGKDHTSHRMVAMGYTQREAVLILYLIGGALGVVAMFITQADVLESYIVGAVVFLIGVFGLAQLERRWAACTQPTTPKEALHDSEPS